MFNIEVVITEQCNLGCLYCYMNKLDKKMSLETFINFISNIDILLNLYNQENYSIDYFGGEPLLNWDLIVNSFEILRKDSKCKRIGIISNLLEIDQEKINFIKKNNINISFSFDGLWNEFNRPLKDGSSSLKKYESKKYLIKQISPFYCKTMVSPSSLGTLVKNAKYLVEEWGFERPDFSLVRDDIWSKENIQDFKKEIRELTELQIEYINKGKHVLFGFYRLYLLDMIYGKKYGKRKFGCFSGNSGIGLMPEGIAYPCARFGSSKKYPIYDFNTKHFYKENYDIFMKEKNKNPNFYDKCKKCNLYNYCNAGCTFSQMKNENAFEPLDSICKLYKILYNECFYLFDKIGENKLFLELLFN